MPWKKGRPRGPQSPEHIEKRRVAQWGPRPIVPLEVQAWDAWLWRAWRSAFRAKGPKNVSAMDMLSLAAIIASHGRPDNPIAQEVRTALVTLLFDRRRLDWTRGHSLRKHISALPTNADAQLLLARSINAINANLPLAGQAFSIPVFVEAVAKLGSVPAVERHVRLSLQQPDRIFKTIGAIVQPNSVEYVAKQRHGMYRVGCGEPGEYNSAEQCAEYAEQLARIRSIS